MSMRHFLMSLTMLSVLCVGASAALSGEPGCPASAAPAVAAAPDQMPAAPARSRYRSAGCCWGDHYAPWDSAATYPYWVFGYPKQSYYQRPSYQNPGFGYYYSGSRRYNADYNPGP
jgi:hypothetical protein